MRRVTFELATEVREESACESPSLERDDESIDSNGPRDDRDPDLRSITRGRPGAYPTIGAHVRLTAPELQVRGITGTVVDMKADTLNSETARIRQLQNA